MINTYEEQSELSAGIQQPSVIAHDLCGFELSSSEVCSTYQRDFSIVCSKDLENISLGAIVGLSFARHIYQTPANPDSDYVVPVSDIAIGCKRSQPVTKQESIVKTTNYS